MADLRAQGRPKRNGEELVVVSVKVPASQAERLRRVAGEMEVSLSRLLRERLWLESVEEDRESGWRDLYWRWKQDGGPRA